MCPKEISIDESLHVLLMQGTHDRFTIRELSDAYAEFLQDDSLNDGNLKRHVYNQILGMVEVGWVKRVRVTGGGDQAFQLLAKPRNLEVTLARGWKRLQQRAVRKRKQVNAPPSQECLSSGLADSHAEVDRYLGKLLEEIRIEFLSSMGTAERYKQLIDELPHLKGKIEGAYLAARDRSSRLQGHLRAVEETLLALRT